MEIEKIKNYFTSFYKWSKENLIMALALILVLLLMISIRQTGTFVFVKSNSSKVKIEVYDMCLDSLSPEDTCTINDFLSDMSYTPNRIEFIAHHCTAGPLPKKPSKKQDWIDFFYLEKYYPYKMVGYNYLVDINRVIELSPINKNSVLEKSEVAWGVAGFNSRTVSIAYIGGLEKRNGKWINKDTRTPRQKFLMDSITNEVLKLAPWAKVTKHREFPNVKKTCPNF